MSYLKTSAESEFARMAERETPFWYSLAKGTLRSDCIYVHASRAILCTLFLEANRDRQRCGHLQPSALADVLK